MLKDATVILPCRFSDVGEEGAVALGKLMESQDPAAPTLYHLPHMQACALPQCWTVLGCMLQILLSPSQLDIPLPKAHAGYIMKTRPATW